MKKTENEFLFSYITGTKVMAHCEIIASCPLRALRFPSAHALTHTGVCRKSSNQHHRDGFLLLQVEKNECITLGGLSTITASVEAAICFPGMDLVAETVQIKQCIMGISANDPIRNAFGSISFFLLCHGRERGRVFAAPRAAHGRLSESEQLYKVWSARAGNLYGQGQVCVA